MWGSDETLSVGLDVQNVTIQYNIIAESLDNSLHPEGPHGKGLLIGSYGDSDYYSIHHNIFAFNTDRNPLINGFFTAGLLRNPFHNEIINNYLYHINTGSTIWGDVHYIGNYHDTVNRFTSHTLNMHTSNDFMDDIYVYVEDNYGPTRTYSSQPEWDIVRKTSTGVFPNQAFEYIFEPSGITTHKSSQIKELLLAENGAGAVVPFRDGNTKRMINEIKTGSGEFKDCVGSEDIYYPTGPVVSATQNAIVVELPFTYSEQGSAGTGYQNKKIKITSGKGAGQIRDIDKFYIYEAKADISPDWSTIPDFTSEYAVITNCSVNAGGWKLLPEAHRPQNFDTDQDGMPDDWEVAHGLNPNVFDAHNNNIDEGYKNIEIYINSFFTN